MSHLIEAKGLGNRFGDHKAVDGAIFNVNPGGIVRSAAFSFLVILLAAITYILAHGPVTYALPIVIMGLAVMASETWFFVHWCTKRVEAAWSRIGAD
jgi:hypothetical protein